MNLSSQNKIISDFMKGDNLEYHKNWNLIMSVITKINNIEHDIKLPEESDGWYAYHSLESMLITVDIESTMTDIVKFINWYNKIK